MAVDDEEYTYSLEVVGLPTKTNYMVGEVFDASGMSFYLLKSNSDGVVICKMPF